MKWGVLFRWGSAWIGGHWSPGNKRLCVNFLPFVTVWFAFPGGNTPDGKPVMSPIVLDLVDQAKLWRAAYAIDMRAKIPFNPEERRRA